MQLIEEHVHRKKIFLSFDEIKSLSDVDVWNLVGEDYVKVDSRFATGGVWYTYELTVTDAADDKIVTAG